MTDGQIYTLMDGPMEAVLNTNNNKDNYNKYMIIIYNCISVQLFLQIIKIIKNKERKRGRRATITTTTTRARTNEEIFKKECVIIDHYYGFIL